MKNVPTPVARAFALACEVRDRAYSPYSKLNVGAVLKLRGQEEYISGCNIENASYGATICAERSAVCQALSRFGSCEFEFLVLTSSSPSGVIPPCGLCLQVLHEFVAPEFVIYLGDSQEILEQCVFSDFFPKTFSKDMLPSPKS